MIIGITIVISGLKILYKDKHCKNKEFLFKNSNIGIISKYWYVLTKFLSLSLSVILLISFIFYNQVISC